MKPGWKTVKLGEVTKEFIVPQRDKPKNLTGDIPWCRIEDIDGVYLSGSKSGKGVTTKDVKEMPLRVFPAGTVIVSCSADLGRCAIVSKPLITNQTFLGIVPDETIDARYLYYLLRSRAEQLNSMATGATIKYLSRDKFALLEIPLPPLAEQKRIVALLDEAFAGIDKAKANVEANLKNAYALFESHLEDAFASADAEWIEAKLSDILEKQPQNGWSPPAANHSESGTPVLTLSSVTGFKFKPDKIKHTSAKVDTSKGYWINNGDLVITRSNTPELVGHVAIVAGISTPTIYPDLIMRMTPKLSRATTAFLYYQLRTRKLREQITSRAQGANPTMKKISNEAVRTLPISLPPIVKQDEIVKGIQHIESASQELSSNFRQALAALSEMKASILTRAFAGELTA